MKPHYPKDVEAEIYFLTPEEGGRRTPFTSGYRPQFYYDGHDWDAIQNYPDEQEPVHPGDTVTAYLSFLSPHCHVGQLFPGKEFLVREGARTVGRGRITKILELEKSAETSKAHEAQR
jgi:translation elongation factor EF-Tu-like GTPase